MSLEGLQLVYNLLNRGALVGISLHALLRDCLHSNSFSGAAERWIVREDVQEHSYKFALPCQLTSLEDVVRSNRGQTGEKRARGGGCAGDYSCTQERCESHFAAVCRTIKENTVSKTLCLPI